MEQTTSFFGSLVIQWRVIRALLMREIITRYGRHNIGFFWLFFEPFVFCVGVTEIWLHLHKGGEHGLAIAAFTITGYSTILLWRNTGNRCTGAITPNLSLLYHRNVRVIDVLASRVILELSGCIMSFVLILILGISSDFMKPPEDWTLLAEGYLMMMWFAASLAIFVCACTELSEVFEKMWHPFTYFMLPISGLTYMVDWLPHWLQKYTVLVPMVNGTEMLRGGYFGRKVHVYYSVPYLSCWCLGLMIIGLCFLKLYARRIEPQ